MSDRYQNYQYQVSYQGGTPQRQTNQNTNYQRTVHYTQGETQTRRVVHYSNSKQQYGNPGQPQPQPQQYYEQIQAPSQNQPQVQFTPQKQRVNVETRQDFDEGVHVQDLKEEYIDLENLDELMDKLQPEFKMHKKKSHSVKKTADDFEMHVTFKKPETGRYPKDNKRLPKKGERYQNVNTNFGNLA